MSTRKINLGRTLLLVCFPTQIKNIKKQKSRGIGFYVPKTLLSSRLRQLSFVVVVLCCFSPYNFTTGIKELNLAVVKYVCLVIFLLLAANL
jgi:hypothetical protein